MLVVSDVCDFHPDMWHSQLAPFSRYCSVCVCSLKHIWYGVYTSGLHVAGQTRVDENLASATHANCIASQKEVKTLNTPADI